MTKVKILEAVAGHADPVNGLPEDFSYRSKQIVSLDDALAQKWIASGIAEVVGQTPAVERT